MLKYALINYKVHVILKHPAAIQYLMGGGLSQYMGRARGALNAVKKYLWRSSIDSKVAGYKPASLQIY